MPKVYPPELKQDLIDVGAALTRIQKKNNIKYRSIAKFSSLSVNSVKSVLAGNTANIASYDMVARSLGTTLISLIQGFTSSDEETESIVATPAAVTVPGSGGALSPADF